MVRYLYMISSHDTDWNVIWFDFGDYFVDEIAKADLWYSQIPEIVASSRVEIDYDLYLKEAQHDKVQIEDRKISLYSQTQRSQKGAKDQRLISSGYVLREWIPICYYPLCQQTLLWSLCVCFVGVIVVVTDKERIEIRGRR